MNRLMFNLVDIGYSMIAKLLRLVDRLKILIGPMRSLEDGESCWFYGCSHYIEHACPCCKRKMAHGKYP